MPQIRHRTLSGRLFRYLLSLSCNPGTELSPGTHKNAGRFNAARSQAPPVVPAAAPTTSHLVDGENAAVCSYYAWRYYNGACLYDARGPVHQTRKVRFVLIDRRPPRAWGADGCCFGRGS